MPKVRISGLEPERLWRWLLMAGFVVIAAANLPGHLSTDSVIALTEGRTGERVSWGPPMYSAIVGVFDELLPGAGLYVAFTLLILLGSWAAMALVRPRVSWLAPVALLAALSMPQVLIYQGIVWKDVLFANLAVAAFVALALAGARWGAPQARLLVALSWILLAFACLVRQNGAVAVVFAALALGWISWSGGWRRSLAWGVAGFVAPLALAFLLNAVTPVKEAPGAVRQEGKGVRLVQNYDIAAVIAQSPQRPLPILDADNPTSMAILRNEVPAAYSPERIDTLNQSRRIGSAFRKFSEGAVQAQWFQLMREEPLGYAKRRFQVFRWTFMTPMIDRCLPVHVGVEGPPSMVEQLRLTPGIEPQDQNLYNYATWWLDTPAFSHVAYAVVALASAAFLLLRRAAGDVAMAGLSLASLAFAASFFVISIACDYRYLYFLDISAITAVLYIALDPRLKPRR